MSALAILRDEDTATAVLHPIRRRVLHALRRPGSATTVGAELSIPRQKVNYHLRALEDLGLVEHVEDRKRGNCVERVVRARASHYLIDSVVLGELEATPQATADRLSAEHLATISARTVTELAELRERAARADKRLPSFSLETAVRFASPADQAAFVQGLSDAIGALIERYHDGRAEGGRWFRVVVGAHPALAAGTDRNEDEKEEER